MGKRSITEKVQIDTGVLAGGAILAVIGSLLVGVGMLLGGIAFGTAIRGWARSLEKPPAEFAKHHIHKLRSATEAGVKAWSNGMPEAAHSGK
jgi:hypothetical protein